MATNPTADRSVPSLHTLYWNDPAFRRAASLAGFALFAAAGLWWFSRPMPNADPAIAPGLETTLFAKAPLLALAVSVLALLAAAWRLRWVKGVFTHGEPVEGTVLELVTSTWETSANRDQSRGINTTTKRTYRAKVRYSAGGEERTVTLLLPHAASNYGLKQDGPVALMVHDSAPGRPLVRAVYLEQIRRK